KFNRPVHINEFHCGEIYESSFSLEQCLKSLDKHLTDLKSQTIANLESVHIYELFDEPSKPAPENRFGLMSNTTTAKVNMFLVTAFAGGNLTAAEQSQVTSRGLLTDAEIAAYKSGGAPPTNPPPVSYSFSVSSPSVGST